MFLEWLIESKICELCNKSKEEARRILCEGCWYDMKTKHPNEFKVYMRGDNTLSNSSVEQEYYARTLYKEILKRRIERM